jgi:DNA-binding MarR family transcriptional regulator
MAKSNSSLRFNGSVWCNLDIALRNLDQLFRQQVQSLGLSVIELYILRALYERDGQHASELAKAVGRAATSFTPNLDKLQSKELIERRPDPTDRRAVRIYLTSAAHQIREEIIQNTDHIDAAIKEMFPSGDFQAFQRVLSGLQSLNIELEGA